MLADVEIYAAEFPWFFANQINVDEDQHGDIYIYLGFYT